MAATTTDLATNNPMRLLPIVAVLIAIVLLLVILAVIFVIIIRGRNGCANTLTTSSAGVTQAQASSAAPTLAVANASYQKPHSSSHSSLRQPLTGLETTSIDDYHHHPHNNRQGRARNSTSPNNSYNSQFHGARKSSSNALMAASQQASQEMNSPDLILPAAASTPASKGTV